MKSRGTAAALLLLLADRSSKEWALLQSGKNEPPRLPWAFRYSFLKNKGACMGIGSGRSQTVRNLSLIVSSIVTIRAVLTKRNNPLRQAADAMVIAGAWGNTADRLLRGYVVDFLQVKCKNKRVSRVTFNLADVWIAFGTVLGLAAAVIFPHKE